MAQTTSFAIANDSGVAVRARLNEVLAALASSNAGAVAPVSTVPGMLWFDTGVTPPTLRRRTAANDGWQADRDPVLTTFDSSRITLRSADGAETLADFLANGGAYLRHDNVNRFWTTATGAEIYGALEVDTLNGAALAGGYFVPNSSLVDDGTKSSGTYTPAPSATSGNFRKVANGGAFTLAAVTGTNSFTALVLITNTASAGAITLSGFTKTTGDPFTTTSGDAFFVFIAKLGDKTMASVVALQ
ncbi:MAG: hypothetical protein K0B16_19115 [Burkholderiaceae bacterium]|nr:hypothetical protein [Burkholderiaceae bacterium]